MQIIYSFILIFSLLSTAIFAQEQIGVAAAVNRNTTDLTLEQERKLVEAGYQIIQNHTIETDEIGKAQMLLLDGTAFSVGPNSSVVLDRFIYNPETAEGSLEVTARGLLRIVGGKVTKKQPALIRTNSATVGIRGGIGIVQTDGSQVNATFLYGEEMTVTPNCVDLDTFGDQCGADFITTITEPGFSVTVESADSEPSEPEPVTEESLEAVQDELEASEEEPAEEESSSDESSSEESSEESSNEESSDESSSEESSDESSSDESSSEESSDDSSSDESSSDENSDDSSSDDSSSSDESSSSSDESSSDESAPSDSSADDASSDSSSDEPTTEVAQETESDTEVTTEVADAGGDGGTTEVEVDEGLLDSSGVSDVSSDVAPDELGTADAFEVETEVDLVDVDESSTEEVTEEVAQTTQETTAEVAPIFEVETEKVIETVDENTTEISLASFAVVNPGDQDYKVTVEGEGSEAFTYNQETNALELNQAVDFETQDAYEVTVTFTSENGDVQEVALALNVADVDEAVDLTVEPVNTISETAISAVLVANQVNVSETVAAGTVIATFNAKDPEGKPLTYNLTGTNSDLFKVSESGEVTLTGSLNYEVNQTITLAFEVSDGVNKTIEEITINVVNDDEAASIETLLTNETYAENLAVGTVVGTVNAKDPEGNAVTLSLSGEGSDNFKIDENGNITLAQALDYETASSYELTVVANDGKNAATDVFKFTVADINEAPVVETKVEFNSFLENTAAGAVIAKSDATDAEADKISYSLAGTGSDLFKVDEKGTVTLAGSLDFESAKSYELTLVADDGTNKVSTVFTVNVGDVNEAPVVSAKVEATAFAENTAKGTTIATASANDEDSDTITYSLAGTGSENFAIDADGKVTLASDLDYETTTSYEITIIASDGSTSSKETITINVSDVAEFALALSSTTPAVNEGVSTGTQVATSTLTQQDSASVTYSLSGTGSDKFAISSSGVITTAAAMDYETTSSYSLTVTVTDGTNTDTETINISINDLSINTLATTLANSGAALAESSSSGTAVASSSINNPDSETVSYTLSGTGSDKFSVDSSGNVTTNGTLDFETAKSYSLTLTATAGSTSVTDTFTVNVANAEELASAVLRYSAAYNSASRSGFSATATRGPSGSSLPAYYLEQVGTSNTSEFTIWDNTQESSVQVEINPETVTPNHDTNWKYYFPLHTSDNGRYAFAPNSQVRTGKYQTSVVTTIETTISNSEFITAGRLGSAEYYFMTTDKSAADINFVTHRGGYTSITDYSASFGYANDLLNNVNNQLGGTEIDWNSACSNNINGCIHKSVKIDLPSAFTYYDQSITSLWVHSNGYVSSLGSRLGNNEYLRSSSDGQKGYALDTLYDNRTWDEGNKPSNVALNGTTLNYSMFPFWTAQNLDSTSRGYYVDQTGTTGLFIIGWYQWELYSSQGKSNYEIVLNYNTNAVQFRYGTLPNVDRSVNNRAIGLTGDLSTSGCSWAGNSNSARTCAGAYEAYLFRDSHFAQNGDEGYNTLAGNGGITFSPSAGTQGNDISSTYNLFEDQVVLAGEIYTDTDFANFTSGNKRVIAMAVIPIENFAASGSSNDYFYPNFIPTNLWSYGDVGHDYCLGVGNSSSDCNTYGNYYDFSSTALDASTRIDTARFYGTTNELPEGQSLWWQVLNPSGVGVGLWAQISFKDSYDGANGSTTRDDQESLLNVVISNVDYRKNDTTRYSAGDTGLGMDGYHYWSYQGATNADNDGLGINFGTSPIECATSSDSGCFWAESANQPGGAMITSSDPYKSGDMTLSVNYNSNNDTFSTGSFNISAVVQDVTPTSSSYADYASLSNFRSSDFYSSSASSYSGFFSGILEFDVSGSGNSQLASMRSSSTLASFTFDTTNDDVQVVAPMTISAAPSNNYTSNWTTVDTGSMTLKFGDATNDTAKSAYISSEVFGAEIQDDGAQIDSTSGGSNNLAGVMVSYNTLDKEDSDLFHTNGNDSMPDTAYSTWGFWAMSSVDISPNTGAQNASVHLGTWVGGETLAQNEIPTSGTASMSGAAVMNVAYRYNQTGTNYDVHKYTTTADVAASFTWGSSGYSGSLDFTNFDDKNAIVANAGFTSFTVAITGTDHTYTGNSTDTLTNGWLGGASVAGALYGDTSPDESGGRINVNLYKSGDTATAGANDFYMAEGIYLLD